ncbi:uncharacterized protein BDZ83DRAFT_735949 [Colletotrichum acutatum]|uniref:Uncharacterized protein n=1 Tax=Glomerella acutata TaxID=27357 RepID=A0AAD8UBZ8_GLOAC|nr:uncharacterized protein BDZ83DRAFT_735949 [Colletotrichum acutatum]KAK1707147.1 hypothetical protein BDZ83DRAFT_735949 [Colletotrichum acutatum]
MKQQHLVIRIHKGLTAYHLWDFIRDSEQQSTPHLKVAIDRALLPPHPSPAVTYPYLFRPSIFFPRSLPHYYFFRFPLNAQTKSFRATLSSNAGSNAEVGFTRRIASNRESESLRPEPCAHSWLIHDSSNMCSVHRYNVHPRTPASVTIVHSLLFGRPRHPVTGYTASHLDMRSPSWAQLDQPRATSAVPGHSITCRGCMVTHKCVPNRKRNGAKVATICNQSHPSTRRRFVQAVSLLAHGPLVYVQMPPSLYPKNRSPTLVPGKQGYSSMITWLGLVTKPTDVEVRLSAAELSQTTSRKGRQRI